MTRGTYGRHLAAQGAAAGPRASWGSCRRDGSRGGRLAALRLRQGIAGRCLRERGMLEYAMHDRRESTMPVTNNRWFFLIGLPLVSSASRPRLEQHRRRPKYPQGRSLVLDRDCRGPGQFIYPSRYNCPPHQFFSSPPPKTRQPPSQAVLVDTSPSSVGLLVLGRCPDEPVEDAGVVSGVVSGVVDGGGGGVVEAQSAGLGY